MHKHWSSTSAACVSFKCWKHKPCTICHCMQSIGRGWVVQQETYQIRSPPLQVQYTRRYVSGLSPLATPAIYGGHCCRQHRSICAGMYCARAHVRGPDKAVTNKDPLRLGHWVPSEVLICVGAESPSHPSHTWEPCVLRALQCVRQYVLHGRMRGGQARPRPTKIPYTLATGCLLVCRYVSGLSPLATPVTPGSRVF